MSVRMRLVLFHPGVVVIRVISACRKAAEQGQACQRTNIVADKSGTVQKREHCAAMPLCSCEDRFRSARTLSPPFTIPVELRLLPLSRPRAEHTLARAEAWEGDGQAFLKRAFRLGFCSPPDFSLSLNGQGRLLPPSARQGALEDPAVGSTREPGQGLTLVAICRFPELLLLTSFRFPSSRCT